MSELLLLLVSATGGCSASLRRLLHPLILQEIPWLWLQIRFFSPSPCETSVCFDVMCAPFSCHSSPIPQALCLSPLVGSTMVQPASRCTMVSRQWKSVIQQATLPPPPLLFHYYQTFCLPFFLFSSTLSPRLLFSFLKENSDLPWNQLPIFFLFFFLPFYFFIFSPLLL